MSFSVIVNESTAAPAKGAPTDTGTAFFTGVIGGGDSTKANLVTDMGEFEGIYTPRATTGAAPLYDAVETFFGEGGAQAWIGGYVSSGAFTDGLALLDDRRKGPGQLALIGAPALTSTIAGEVATFLANNNRVGLIDVPSADTVAEIETLAAQMPANTELMAMFGSWAKVPGPRGVVGAGPRTVPASAVIAGMCNRVDMDGNPNRAVGGRDYPLQFVNSLVLDPNDTDRQALLDLGVNMFADDFGVLIGGGFQTNIPASAYETTPFWQLNCARARMWLKANAAAIGAGYYLRPIDGQGRLAAQLKSDIDVLCKALYDAGGLYGKTPQQAYKNTVTQTLTQVAQGTLDVTCEAKFSLHAQAIRINLVSIPVTASI